jgi:peptide/nickel transport system permease protein
MLATRPRLRATLLRIVQALPVVVGVVVISFVLTRALPGDPAVYFAGAAADEASIEQVRVAMGLDKPMLQQFVVYVGDLLQGDLGQSLSTGRPVAVDLATRLPASLELTLTALLLAILVAVPLGVLAATRPGSWVDHLCRVVVTAGVSLPTFFTGILLIYILYYLLGWAPSPLGRLDFIYLSPEHITGFFLIDAALVGDWETWWGAARQLMLPAATMALFTLAPIARMTRAAMLTALSSDFIRTAKAAGLSNRE